MKSIIVCLTYLCLISCQLQSNWEGGRMYGRDLKKGLVDMNEVAIFAYENSQGDTKIYYLNKYEKLWSKKNEEAFSNKGSISEFYLNDSKQLKDVIDSVDSVDPTKPVNAVKLVLVVDINGELYINPFIRRAKGIKGMNRAHR